MVSASACLEKVPPQSFYALIVDTFSSNAAASILTSVHNHEGCYIQIFHSMVTSDPRWNTITFSGWHKGLIHCSGSVVVRNLHKHYQTTVAVNPTMDNHTPSKNIKKRFLWEHNSQNVKQVKAILFVCLFALNLYVRSTMLQLCIELSLNGHSAYRYIGRKYRNISKYMY